MKKNKEGSFRSVNAGDPRRTSRNLGRLIMQLQRLERSPKTFGEAGKLTPSEIHLIDAIGCDNTVLMGELAKALGVTKGAVTQIVDRLERIDLLERIPHPTDLRSTYVSLTQKGGIAYQAHDKMRLDFYRQLQSQLDDEEMAAFDNAIEKLISSLKK